MNRIDELNELIKASDILIESIQNRLKVAIDVRNEFKRELLEETSGFKCGQLVSKFGEKGILEFGDSSIGFCFRPLKKDGTPSRRCYYVYNFSILKAVEQEAGQHD